MTEPSPVSRDEVSRDETSTPAGPEQAAGQDRFADLAERPVAEHVEVFEDEHGRLQRELGTIDEL
jgi:hypothetical protein